MQTGKERTTPMKSTWLLLSALVFGSLWAPRAYSATVAVMPVRGVNLSEGECDAIGVLFANAFSRDANVAVASPLETKSIRRQVQTSLEAATRMGVSLYAELTAMQLGTNVKLQGMLFGKDGREIYRAGTVAPSLDDMEIETAKLARALILRQPVPRAPRPVPEAAAEVPAAPEVPEAPPEPIDPNATGKALGAKAAFMLPMSSGRTFSPMISAEFNGRVGSRGYFVEFGAGAAISPNDSYMSTDLQISTVFLEVGGSFYLSEGSTALYLGAGLSPGIWMSKTGLETRSSGSMAAYGQLGVNLTRDSRFKFYGEIRVSQYLLGVVDPVVDSYGEGTGNGSAYHPTLVAMQIGVGW